MPANHRTMARTSAATRSATATRRAADLAPMLAAFRTEGSTSLRILAARLTEAGIAAPRAAVWHPMTVKRILDRIESVTAS